MGIRRVQGRKHPKGDREDRGGHIGIEKLLRCGLDKVLWKPKGDARRGSGDQRRFPAGIKIAKAGTALAVGTDRVRAANIYSLLYIAQSGLRTTATNERLLVISVTPYAIRT